MKNALEGKVAVVTGANSGIGLAIATALAQAGSHVVISGRRQSRNQAVADEGKADHIKAVAICPAMVATPMTGVSGPDYLQPEDIAETVLYLLRLSPAAWPTAIVLERKNRVAVTFSLLAGQ